VITVRYHLLRREFSLTEGIRTGNPRLPGSWCYWLRRQSAALGWQSLFTDRAIDRFAEEVCVAGVAGSLLDEVQQHPPEREVPPVTQRPDR
jgi:hypothetical protein